MPRCQLLPPMDAIRALRRLAWGSQTTGDTPCAQPRHTHALTPLLCRGVATSVGEVQLQSSPRQQSRAGLRIVVMQCARHGGPQHYDSGWWHPAERGGRTPVALSGCCSEGDGLGPCDMVGDAVKVSGVHCSRAGGRRAEPWA